MAARRVFLMQANGAGTGGSYSKSYITKLTQKRVPSHVRPWINAILFGRGLRVRNPK